MIKSICIISQGYPTEKHPWFPFVDQLACAFVLLGMRCTVISPQSITKGLLSTTVLRPKRWIRNYQEKQIEVIQPYYVSFSNFNAHCLRLTSNFFTSSVIKAFKQLDDKNFDVIYGHFWGCGLIAAKIGYEYNIPAFCATGESEINASNLKLEYKDYIKGVIAVSNKCKQESLELGLCESEDIEVFPNGIDDNLFNLKNKNNCRRKLGIPLHVFVVCFVGFFNERKGSKRLSNVLNRFNDVYSIFIGTGDEKPTCKNRLFTGPLPHDCIPEYLNASDVFVLPTLHEGCCNAIIEAMACGLPVISSNKDFNMDILDASNSILVDPLDEDELYEAIKSLKNNSSKRQELSIHSLKKAASLDINSRAQNILEFMEKKINE